MVFRLLFVLGCCALITACGSVSSASAKADDTLRRYYDGQRWIEVRVLLDRLLVERKAGPQHEGGTREVYLMRTPVVSVAALEDVARQMMAAQPDIRALSAYVRPIDTPNAEPRRLTRQIMISVTEAIDPINLLKRHNAHL
ncbi:MAG TPA: hypothetical protein VHX44_12335, partial [Planctomycetota bacterium]|nr:hypothetical protein [Planctomycetota bacterium]